MAQDGGPLLPSPPWPTLRKAEFEAVAAAEATPAGALLDVGYEAVAGGDLAVSAGEVGVADHLFRDLCPHGALGVPVASRCCSARADHAVTQRLSF
jgi:hypothetical protein